LYTIFNYIKGKGKVLAGSSQHDMVVSESESEFLSESEPQPMSERQAIDDG